MTSSVQSPPATGGSVAPPTPQEISRKLSVHNKPAKPVNVLSPTPLSGTESDSDSFFSPEHSPMGGSYFAGASHPHPIAQPHSHASNHGHTMTVGLSTSASSKPLSSIAERGGGSGDEETDEDEDPEGEEDWAQDQQMHHAQQLERKDGESIIRTGYLHKKGERRKTWKKRWFVLRPAHLAFYKDSAEYQLHRLLDLNEVHSCSAVELKRHPHSFVLVSPTRTYYLHSDSEKDMQDWVRRVNAAREALLGTSTQNSVSTPIAIPASGSGSRQSTTMSHSPTATSGGGAATPSPPSARSIGFAGPVTSDSESDGEILGEVPKSVGSMNTSPSKALAGSSVNKDPSKTILSGYLMKSRSKRRGWRKRWFVLTGETLFYSASHMDTKRRRPIELSQVIDALEYDMSNDRSHTGATSVISPPALSASEENRMHDIDPANPSLTGTKYTFKIVTTKRTLLLCAPSEAEEIKWLSAVRALIARRSQPLSGAGSPTGVPGAIEGVPPAAGIKSSVSIGGRKRSASGASGLTLARDEHPHF